MQQILINTLQSLEGWPLAVAVVGVSFAFAWMIKSIWG